jgi:rRNA maturation endonuclease Nob1
MHQNLVIQELISSRVGSSKIELNIICALCKKEWGATDKKCPNCGCKKFIKKATIFSELIKPIDPN